MNRLPWFARITIAVYIAGVTYGILHGIGNGLG